MTATVPRRAATLVTDGVVCAAPVAGSTWGAIGAQANHLLGASHVLIPAFMPGRFVAPTGTLTFPLTIWPRYQTSHRKWTFYAAPPPGDVAYLTVGLPSGATFEVRADGEDARLFEFVEPLLGSQSAAETEVTITVTSSSASTEDAIVHMLGCYALPRGELTSGGGDGGAALETLEAGLPIFESTTGNSVAFVVDQVDAVRETSRRCGFFYATPFHVTTSAVFANVLQQPFVVLGRKRYAGDTKAWMKLRFYATAAVGSVGEIRATMASGAVATWEIPSGHAGRIRGSIPIDCDDLSSTYGRLGVLDDTCTIEVRRVSGAGAVVLQTISAGEAARAEDTVVPVSASRGRLVSAQARPRGRVFRANQ